MMKARMHFQAAVEGIREQVLNAGAKAEELIDIAIRSYFRCEPSLTSDALAMSDEMNQATGRKRTLHANIPKVGLAAARLLHGALEAFARSDGDRANSVRTKATSLC